MYRILFVGESWTVHTQETKGFDVFTFDRYEEAIEYIKAALTAERFAEFRHIPSHRVEYDFPTSAEELMQYDAVMVSDCGANTFNLPMRTFLQLKKTPNRLHVIRDFVARGGAFVMIGGYLTFQGIEAKGAYRGTAIEEILPVSLLSGDDRRENCQGVTPLVTMKDHPVVSGLVDVQWPELLGYNKLLPKPDSQVIAEIDGDPLIVLGEYGLGRVCAYATDCAPHWSPVEFCQWSGYPKLWQNIVTWLKRGE
jgi:uncharacterized membrane protein